MEKKIKEVYDYFKGKVVSGEYEIKDCNEHTVCLIVDGKYPFFIWWANQAYGIETYGEFGKPNTMSLKFNEKEKAKIYSSLRKVRTDFLNKNLIAEKEKELKRLRKKVAVQY